MRRHDHKKGHRIMSTSDHAFRPASYWDPADPRTAVLQNIKGQNRRTIVAQHFEAPILDQGPELDAAFMADDVGHDDRIALGRLHPSWMGGEYLPDYRPGEVEIARIVLESVLQDVVSIRARRRGKDRRILYRVVDEYESEFHFSPRSSRQPLTQGQLVRFIDTLENGAAPLEDRTYIGNILYHDDCLPVEELARFVTVESLFYPTLGEHFRAVTWELARALRDED
jgi:hypothetical protein